MVFNPFFVDPNQFFIQRNIFAGAQRIKDSNHIACIYQSARAKSAFVIMKRHAPKYSNFISFFKWQGTVVIFQ